MDLQFVILLVSFGLTSTTDIFSSTAQIRMMASYEPRLTETVQQFVEREEQKIQNVKRTLSTLQNMPYRTQQDIDHPLIVYKMIRRWRAVLTGLGSTENAELVIRCSDLGIPVVSDIDLMGATAAVIRLQRTYALPTAEMFHGIVYGVRSEPLSHDDAFELGKAALIMGDYKYAVEWLEIAAMADPSAVPYRVADANFELAKTHYYIGDYGTAAVVMRNAYVFDPYNETIKLHVDIYNRQNESMHLYNNGQPYATVETWRRWVADWKINYERLCRGEFYPVNDTGAPQLFCRYRKTKVPYYQVKEEVLSVDPWIAQLYEVIHPTEIQRIKDMAMPQLYRAQVGDPAKALTSDERVSKVAWLWDTSGDTFIPMMSKRVSLITGLDTTYRNTWASAEPFQVVNYGIGGQYEPHYDFYESDEHRRNQPHYLRDSGERLSTFMFYLTNVQAGGATVFPYLNIRVPATEGSAAYWFNIKKNGDHDRNTQHAGCPVLLGEKWVANKWIREYGQEFRRPCGLTYDAKETGY